MRKGKVFIVPPPAWYSPVQRLVWRVDRVLGYLFRIEMTRMDEYKLRERCRDLAVWAEYGTPAFRLIGVVNGREFSFDAMTQCFFLRSTLRRRAMPWMYRLFALWQKNFDPNSIFFPHHCFQTPFPGVSIGTILLMAHGTADQKEGDDHELLSEYLSCMETQFERLCALPPAEFEAELAVYHLRDAT